MSRAKHTSSAGSLSLERSATLVDRFFTNKVTKISLGDLDRNLRSNRDITTTLKLNHKRLAWGDKTPPSTRYSFSSFPGVPYRSVDLDSVRDVLAVARYPTVLLCVLLTPNQAQFKYEVVAFELKNDLEVRNFLDLYATLTEAPPSASVFGRRDREASTRRVTIDRDDVYTPISPGHGNRNKPSLVRLRSHPSATMPVATMPIGTLPPAARHHQPVSDGIIYRTDGVSRGKKVNNEMEGIRTTSDRQRYSERYSDVQQPKHGDRQPTRSSSLKKRSQVGTGGSRDKDYEWPPNRKSFGTGDIPEAEFTTRAVIDSRPRSDSRTPEDDRDSGHTDDEIDYVTSGGVQPDRSRRKTLVDNGKVKVTVEEYQDPREGDAKGHLPNGRRSERTRKLTDAHSVSEPNLNLTDSDEDEVDGAWVNTPHTSSHRSRKSVVTTDRIRRIPSESTGLSPMLRSSAMTASVRKVFSRPVGHRNPDEYRVVAGGRRSHKEERGQRTQGQYLTPEVIYQSRPGPVRGSQSARAMHDDVYQSRSATIRPQPMNAMPGAIYQSRSATNRPQPINAMPDVVYQSRSAVIRPQSMSVMPETIYQSRQPEAIYQSRQPEAIYQSRQPSSRQHTMYEYHDRGNGWFEDSHRESGNGYGWRYTTPPEATIHPKRTSVYRTEERTLRR